MHDQEHQDDAAIATDETESQVQREPASNGKRSAADKLMDVLRALSKPDENSEDLELMLASLAMAVENTVGAKLPEYQERGEIDPFLMALCRFLAAQRSDDAPELLVVELPRREKHAVHQLQAGVILHAVDQAADAAKTVTSPLW